MFLDDNTENIVSNLMHDLWSSAMAASVQHARSNLSAVSMNAKYFGYDFAADWINDTAALVDNTMLDLQMLRPDSMFASLRNVEGPAKVPAKIIWVSTEALFPWVATFGGLNSVSSLLKGAWQSAESGLIFSDTSINKLLQLPIAPLRSIMMVFTQDSEGKPRAMTSKSKSGNPKMTDIKQDVLQQYRDAIHNIYLNNLILHGEEGKTYTGPMALNTRLASVATNWTFQKMKERFELHNSKVAIDFGAQNFEAVRGFLEKGDAVSAWNVVKDSLFSMSRVKAFEIFSVMVKAYHEGRFDESAYTYLPVYHDLNIGRFGSVTLPTMVKQMKRYVIGSALFASAINLFKSRYIAMATVPLLPIPGKTPALNAPGVEITPQNRALGALLLAMGSSFMTAGIFSLLENGLPEQVGDVLLTEEQKTMLGEIGDDFDIERSYAKFVATGIAPWWKTGTISSVKWDDFFKKGFYEGVKSSFQEMSGWTSVRGRGFNPPVFGLQADKIADITGIGFQLLMSRSLTPEAIQANSVDIAANNDYWIKMGSKTVDEYLASMTSPDVSVREAAEEKYITWKKQLPDKFFDALYRASPINLFADILSNPFVGYHVWQTMKEEMGTDRVVDEARLAKTEDKLTYDLMNKPATNLLQMSPLPNVPGLSAFYKIAGLDKVIDGVDTYGQFLDKWVVFLTAAGAIDPTFAKQAAEKGKKNYFLMTGVHADQVDREKDASLHTQMDEKMQKRIEAKSMLRKIKK
jgi:hypothetical protein